MDHHTITLISVTALLHEFIRHGNSFGHTVSDRWRLVYVGRERTTNRWHGNCSGDYDRDGTRRAIRSMHPPPFEVRIKKYPSIYIHEGGWPIGKLPFSEETLESDENQRVAKFTKIAGRWNHYTERKGNIMGWG